ncbi:O-antigen translocase [Geomonas sp. Red276]
MSQGSSYRNILKSTILIGGSSALNILIGMVRAKFVATLIGPAGVGLIGTYNQITGLVTTVSGLGLGRSGVRQVAEAVGSGDDAVVARTVLTLRRTVWITGAIGMLAMVLFCFPISHITFSGGQYAWSIALLGITILLSSIASGQACVLQGNRRVGDLARISVLGALNGTLISIPCFYLWGMNGIVPSMILSAAAALVTSWWFARRVPVRKVPLSWGESRDEARQLLSLGVGLMGGSLVSNICTYLVQILIVRQFNLEGAGICQAALGLSAVFVGFVLSAMGTDYYPRLAAVSNDHQALERMVNEQLEVSILLALPGLAAMIVMAPWIIRLFYSSSFVAAVPVLRWCCFGMLGRVFSWPLGYVLMAKGKGRLCFMTDAGSALMHLASVFLLSKLIGINGVGMALIAQNVFYTAAMVVIIKKVAGVSWSRGTTLLTLFSLGLLSLLMVNLTYNDNVWTSWGINIALVLLSVLLCLRQLVAKSEMNVWEYVMAKLRLT